MQGATREYTGAIIFIGSFVASEVTVPFVKAPQTPRYHDAHWVTVQIQPVTHGAKVSQ